MINKDWFSSTEWNTSQLIKIIDRNDRNYEDILANCSKEIPDEKPCDEIKFENTVEINQPDLLIKKIDLQLDVVELAEEETSTWYKLALDLVSIQDIFFGFTMFGSL